MKIVWDASKRLRNLEIHRIDFADARERFAFEDAAIAPTRPGTDGRTRFIAIGPLDGRIVTIVFSSLGTEALSLISVRRASRKERKAYDQQ
jgi:uncharacterized DUF497 family protein